MKGRFLLISLHNIIVFVIIKPENYDVRLQYNQTLNNCQTISELDRPRFSATVDFYLNSHAVTITDIQIQYESRQ